jgi:hypothetical protein
MKDFEVCAEANQKIGGKSGDAKRYNSNSGENSTIENTSFQLFVDVHSRMKFVNLFRNKNESTVAIKKFI